MSKIIPRVLILHARRTDRKALFVSHNSARFSSTTSSLVPSHKQIAELILEQNSSSQALQTFEWASNIPNFTHSLSTYRALIHKVCAFRQFNIVSQLLDEIPKTTGLSVNDDIFITVVRGYGRARMLKEAIRVLDLVPKLGKGTPSLKLLNSVLDVLVKEDIDIAREFYRKKMMGSGVKGDDYTYAILMKGFCLTNRIRDGFKLLKVMKNHNVKVSVVVYNTLIHALCKNGKPGRARSLMNEMGEFSDVTFNILISAYCDGNYLIQALVMTDKCFNRGFVPDVVSLTKLVEMLCNAGRITEAVEVLERAEGKGGVLDVVAHNTLLKGFVKAGKVEAAHGFLKQMEMKGCLPNTETYNILIKGFCEFRMLTSAYDLFHEMKRVGVPWSLLTFETLIHGFCSSGRTRDGFKIFELMIEDKQQQVCRINIGPYNSILYGLHRENCSEQALEFLNYMRNLFPRAVDRSWAILRLCEESRIEEAKQVLDKMHEEGSFPSALVYANLIQGFCEKGFVKDAIELMNEMIGRGYFPVASTINAVIGEFRKRGRVGAAARLMEDLLSRDQVLDLERCVAIINEICSEAEMQVVLVDEMVGRGITPNYYIWNAVSVSTLEGRNLSHEHQVLIQQLVET